jgi:hypothetical protein
MEAAGTSKSLVPIYENTMSSQKTAILIPTAVKTGLKLCWDVHTYLNALLISKMQNEQITRQMSENRLTINCIELPPTKTDSKTILAL